MRGKFVVYYVNDGGVPSVCFYDDFDIQTVFDRF